MGMAAILVMWPGPFEQTLFPLSQGETTWNLASFGPVVSEEKMFENIDEVQRTTEACLYYKLTSEPWTQRAIYFYHRGMHPKDPKDRYGNRLHPIKGPGQTF